MEFGKIVDELKGSTQTSLATRLRAQQKLNNLNESLCSNKNESFMKFKADRSVIVKGVKKDKYDNQYNDNRKLVHLENELKKSNNMNTILMREIAKLKDSKSKKKEQLDNTLREIKKNTEYSVTKNIDLHVSPMKDLVLETIISPIEKTNFVFEV